VHHDQLAVAGGADVELQHVRALADRRAEREHRGRRQLVLAALVGHVEDAVVEPRVRGGRRGGGDEDEDGGGEQRPEHEGGR
jgi:hypothetical protein